MRANGRLDLGARQSVSSVRLLRERRAALAAFLSAGRHIGSKPPHQPLTVTAIARVIGVAPNTLRRWLRADHHELYWDHWATFTEQWKAAQEAQARLPRHARDDKRYRRTLMDALNSDLERLMSTSDANMFAR